MWVIAEIHMLWSDLNIYINIYILEWVNYQGASLVAQMVKNLVAVQETWVWFPDWEDLLEKGMATHSSILFFKFILISWRLVTLQYCSGFCHTLTWISLGYTCIPHPDPPSHILLHPIPLGLPSAPGPSTCLMHPTWAGDLFHPR